MSHDSAPEQKKKKADLQDIQRDGLTDAEAANISAGGTFIPCIRPTDGAHGIGAIEPCIKPSVEPCLRSGNLPGGHTR